MAKLPEWRTPPDVEPKARDYQFDLDGTLSAIVGLSATVPADAFTADTLGTERLGNGIIIGNEGIILTVGYLVTEASEIWLTLANGRTVRGDVIGYDQETGFALVQALGRLETPGLMLGHSAEAQPGMNVISAGAGGAHHSVASTIVARQEFAGYWEYVLEDAIFTAPAHPYWGGTGLIGPDGRLLGVGSLQLEQAIDDDDSVPINMYIPIDLLKPILDDMLTMGQANRPPRPWLGVYAAEVDETVVIAGVAGRSPAAQKLRQGDVVLSVGGARVGDLAGMFRAIWSLGKAGVEVPMTIQREGRAIDVTVPSGDRNRFLKGPMLH